MMNKKLQTIKQTLLLLSALAVMSCSNITKTGNDNSNGTGTVTSQDSSEKAYLKLTVDKARTVLPDITGTNLRNLALTGVKTETDSNTTPESQNLGTWDTLTDLQEATIPVSTGQWTFTLTANCGGTKLEGIQEKTIIVGNNTLNFGLKITNAGNGTGSFSITLDFSTAANSSNVNYAVATLENLNGSEVTDNNNTVIVPSQTLTPSESEVTFTATGIPAGTYRARIKLYAASGAEMASYRDLVQISTGCTSSDTQTIESLDELYNVTYHQNDGSLPSGTTLPLTVTRKTIVNLPTLTRDYYDFGGWYTDENFTTGNEITSISNPQSNIDVYAKFTPISYSITYNLNGGTNPDNAITSYTVQDDVTLPAPTKTDRQFEGWYTASMDSVTSWNIGSRHESITIYAKWDGDVLANASTIASTIQNMTENRTVTVIGDLDTEDIRIINSALKNLKASQSEVLVSLDLSQVTGLTYLEAASSSNNTYSFYNCTNLSKIILPDGLNSIQNNTFYNCSGLTSVTIPSNVTQIGNSAFYKCSGLTSITIPSSVTKIGTSAFGSCNELHEVRYKGTLEQWINKNWHLNCIIDNLYINNQKLTEIAIPSSVTQIGNYAFYKCCGITSITIPSGVIQIGNSAFSNCNGLTSVIIPNSVTQIGDSAFSNCSELTSITIPDSVTQIGNAAFSNCSELTSITIPSNITQIEYSLFEGCTSLTSITIPSKVTTIAPRAFFGCTGLTSIILSNSITHIESRAFQGCSGLTSVTLSFSLTQIGNYAFSNCSELTSITIPSSLTLIKEDAFNDCSKLHEVNYNGSIEQWCSITFENYKANPCCSKADLYIGNQKLTNITIQNGIQSIGGFAFCGCRSLTSITISNNMTQIGTNAFYNCIGLTEIIIPNSVTKIGEGGFYGCSNLLSIIIPDSVTQIGQYAFYNCTKLTSVTFESPSNWYSTFEPSDWNNFTNGTEIDFSTSASDNATNLKSTYTYYKCYFYRTN